MHTSNRRPRLGALRSPDPIDLFSVGEVVGRRSPKAGRLLADQVGVERGGRR